MKKIFLFLCLLFYTNLVLATSSIPFDKIVFLGDSLTDDGKLFSLLLYQVPKSPPYYKGRFSNGPTWAENFAKYFYDKHYIGYKVYALGGATAIFHLPTIGFMGSSTLDIQTDFYLVENLLRDKSHTLGMIWIGSNDYLYYQYLNPDILTSSIVDKTINSARRLLNHGMKYLAILNLPDSSLAPYSKKHGDPKVLHRLIMMNNEKLAIGVKELQAEYPDAKITLVDIYNIMMDFMSNPDTYNKRYALHVTNLSDSCWAGGYLTDQFFNANILRQEMYDSLSKNKTQLWKDYGAKAKHIDVEAIVSFIENTPEMKYVYGMGKLLSRGMKPCSNPSEYLFWDSMHPTEVVHRVVFYLVLERISQDMLGKRIVLGRVSK